MAKFGPILKFFVSTPPYLIVLNPFLAKQTQSDQFSIRKFENQTKFVHFKAIFIVL